MSSEALHHLRLIMLVLAMEAAKKLDAEQLDALPGPGEVDFLCGDPPCQGYSGMNRFNKGVKPCARPLLVALRSVLASIMLRLGILRVGQMSVADPSCTHLGLLHTGYWSKEPQT